VLELREVPVPAVREGWSLVRVMGAGLNRSELRTRQGHSPDVRFPRVLGIECVGVVAASTDPLVPEGTTVAAVMGEMGRVFGLDDIAEAYRYMEADQATGKLVVLP
jgi:NADPH:quinone reductase-like Zn-dependent oxidoreductase